MGLTWVVFAGGERTRSGRMMLMMGQKTIKTLKGIYKRYAHSRIFFSASPIRSYYIQKSITISLELVVFFQITRISIFVYLLVRF